MYAIANDSFSTLMYCGGHSLPSLKQTNRGGKGIRFSQLSELTDGMGK